MKLERTPIGYIGGWVKKRLHDSATEILAEIEANKLFNELYEEQQTADSRQ